MFRVGKTVGAIVAAAATALIAAPAHATTASVQSTGMTSITGEPAEANSLEIRHIHLNRIEITERGMRFVPCGLQQCRAAARISAGAGCTAASATVVHCQPTGSLTGLVEVQLGELNDRVQFNLPSPWRGRAYGGSGDDIITSIGTSDDYLSAGAGADVLKAGPGADHLVAIDSDHFVDRLDGGEGSDEGYWTDQDTVVNVETRITAV